MIQLVPGYSQSLPLPPTEQHPMGPPIPLKAYKRCRMYQALIQNRGALNKTARQLGIGPTTVKRFMSALSPKERAVINGMETPHESWYARQVRLNERLKTKEPAALRGIVEELQRRQESCPLSFGDMVILDKAQAILRRSPKA